MPATTLPTTVDDNPFRTLVRTFGLVERVMQPYFARFGISGSQWGVLRALQRAKRDGRAGLRLTDLGERLIIRPPSVTGVIDRLERMALVAREPDPGDMRAKIVSLTKKGTRVVEEVLAVHQTQIDTVLGGLTADEQGELQRLLSVLGRHLQEMIDGGGETAGRPMHSGTPD